jgi:hypothetical protein
VLAFDAVVRFPFGRDLGLVGGQLLGGRVAALLAGPGQDFIGAGAGGIPLPSQVVQQRHGATSSIPT